MKAICVRKIFDINFAYLKQFSEKSNLFKGLFYRAKKAISDLKSRGPL